MQKNIILTLICLILTALAAEAQVRVKPDITYHSTNQKYILGGLAVEGVPGYDEELLKSYSGLEVGKIYDVPGASISQAVRNYWRQGLFSNVAIEADSIVGSTIFLRVKLTAQPRVSSISYNGVKKSEREDIEQRIGMVVGNQINPDVVNRAKTLIKRYFDEKGYKNASIEIEQRDDVTKPNSVLVDVNINKNEKIRVRKIHITGLDSLAQGESLNKLKRAMKKTHEKSLQNFFKSKKFLPAEFAKDKGLTIDRLNGWGYRDALILSDSVVTVDPKHVDIYLTYHRGPKYYIRNINWVGNIIFPTNALQATLKMERGEVYDQQFLNKRLSSDEDAIANEYYNRGYVFNDVRPVEVNVEGDSIDLEIRIYEGQQATLNHIRISGNDRVYEEVIRRELKTKPGDLFTMDALQRSVRELASMNQFDPEILQNEIQKGIHPDPITGTVDINYPLVTKGGDQIELSAGWGQTGIVGRVGLKFTNFSIQNLFGRKGYKRAGFIPQGDGQTLSISGQTNGTYFQSYSLQFLDPWFGKKRPNQFSFSLYYSKQTDVNSNYYKNYSNLYNYYYGYGSSSNYYNYSNYYDPDKHVRLFGASVGFGKRLRWPDDYFNFMAELSYTRYMLKNWQYFLIQNGNCNNLNLTLSISRSSTDNTFFPRRGSELLLSGTFTPPYSLWDGRDYKNLATNYFSKTYRAESQEKFRWIEYHKWKFKFRNFTALASSMKHTPVLMTRAEIGILGHYNKYKKSPFESYYMGGDGMSGYSTGYATETIGLRGYENGSLAGANYDNAYAYTRFTLELRFPIMLETSTSIYALAFLEAGNAWEDITDFNPFSLKKSAGIGARILLPMVGMMGIDWAYGFQKYNSLGSKIGGSQFHFIIGQEF